MYHIRVVKTSSGASAVQVVFYKDRKRIVFKHIGSAKNSQELDSLKLIAHDVINTACLQMTIFEEPKFNNLLYIDKSEFLGIYYSFLYDSLKQLISIIGFDKIKKHLLLDLVIMRIVEPDSKLRSIELLETYFGIQHRRQEYYESAPKWLDLKSKIESLVVSFAKQHYSFNFDLLFYDVTTLYFESFDEDDLRKNGFSKDSKSQQPQILIGLMVNKDGFPIAYEIFAGNVFEGHTIIPVISNFIKNTK